MIRVELSSVEIGRVSEVSSGRVPALQVCPRRPNIRVLQLNSTGTGTERLNESVPNGMVRRENRAAGATPVDATRHGAPGALSYRLVGRHDPPDQPAPGAISPDGPLFQPLITSALAWTGNSNSVGDAHFASHVHVQVQYPPRPHIPIQHLAASSSIL